MHTNKHTHICTHPRLVLSVTSSSSTTDEASIEGLLTASRGRERKRVRVRDCERERERGERKRERKSAERQEKHRKA